MRGFIVLAALIAMSGAARADDYVNITFGFTSPFQNICRSIHAPNLNQVSMRFVLRTHDA